MYFLYFLVFSLGTSSLIASQETQEQKLSEQDKSLLFGSGAKEINVEILSEKEMKETEGEFWGALGAVIAGGQLIYDIGHNNGWWK